MEAILAQTTRRVNNATTKKLGRPRKATTKRRKRSGQRGRIKRLSQVAVVLLKFLRNQVNRYVSRADLAATIKGVQGITEGKVRAAIDQLVYFGYIRKINYQRRYRDGSPSKRSGFILEKIYGHDDKLEMKDQNPTLFESPEERAKIRERRERWGIDNLILPDTGDAAATVRLLKSVGAETIRFFYLNHQGHHITSSIRDVAKIICIAEDKGHNLVARVDGKTFGTLIQLDEVKQCHLELLKPVAFMIFETSPNNFQAWVALPIGTPIKQRKRIRTRLIAGLKAFEERFVNNPPAGYTWINGGSFGEMRWPQSINQKPKHNGFRVRLIHESRGHFITSPELDAAGLLARVPKRERPPKDRSSFRVQSPSRPVQNDLAKTEPDYAALLGKHSQRHIADGLFLTDCILRGFTKVERRQLLLARSTKYQELDDTYFEQRDEWAAGNAKRRQKFTAQKLRVS
jgi:hypothetical protein